MNPIEVRVTCLVVVVVVVYLIINCKSIGLFLHECLIISWLMYEYLREESIWSAYIPWIGRIKRYPMVYVCVCLCVCVRVCYMDSLRISFNCKYSFSNGSLHF